MKRKNSATASWKAIRLTHIGLLCFANPLTSLKTVAKHLRVEWVLLFLRSSRIFTMKLLSLSYICRVMLVLLALMAQLTALQAAETRPIAVLLSGDEPAYQEAAKIYQEELGLPTRQFSFHGRLEEVPRVMDEILAAKPPLILALGAKAAYAAKTWTAKKKSPPVLFAMAINWQQYNFIGKQGNMVGIDTAPTPGSELAYLSLLAPKVRRIGLIHSPISMEIAAEIASHAAALGLKIVTVNLESPADFQTSFKALSSQIDGFLAIRDPLIYNLDNLDWLTERCLKSGIACLGRSPELAERGMMLTISPSPQDTALQAVSMTKAILKGELTIQGIGVLSPLSTRVVLNLKTVARLNLTISEEALDAATEIIR